MSGIETFDLPLPGGVTLACRACGPADAPRVMFLHGFPEGAFVWEEVMRSLADRHRCIAPDLRGYGGSSAPTRVDAYRPKLLQADIAAAIEACGAPLEMLVAHDWGGAVAWNLASQQPHLMRRLLMINSPHPALFLRDLQHDPAQQRASEYMNVLRRPDAEALLAEDDFARLWHFFRGADWMTDELREQYRALWRRGLTGPVNYYRASPLHPPTGPDDAILQLALPPGFGTVPVPTLVLWGEADGALLPTLLDGLEGYLPRGEIVRVPGASHWIVHEQPALVAAQARRWLDQTMT